MAGRAGRVGWRTDSAGPADARYAVAHAHATALDPAGGALERRGISREVAQHRHTTRIGAPHIDAAAEANAEDVGCAPVDKVQVVVIGELGRVKHLEGTLGDVARRLARREKDVLRDRGDGRERVGWVGRVIKVDRRASWRALDWRGVPRERVRMCCPWRRVGEQPLPTRRRRRRKRRAHGLARRGGWEGGRRRATY